MVGGLLVGVGQGLVAGPAARVLGQDVAVCGGDADEVGVAGLGGR